MRERLRTLNDEMYEMVKALVASWPALVLAALFVFAALIIDCGGGR